MSLSTDDILKLIEEELFVYSLECGQGHKSRQIVPRKAPVAADKKLYNVVPDTCYRPHIRVAFDFSQQFVLATSVDPGLKAGKVVGERPVSKETVKRVAFDLLTYFQYYFEGIGSYQESSGSSKDNVSTYAKSVLDSGSEREYVHFINIIINYFLTSVNINRVRNDVSTCELSFRDSPQKNATRRTKTLFTDENFSLLGQLFVPMIPFTVWASGRIYKDFYFPIFTGYITRSTPSNAQGYSQFKVNGRDALELARISYEMLNPALINIEQYQDQPPNFFAKLFYGVDHIQIARSMFVGGALVSDANGQRVIVALQEAKSGEKDGQEYAHKVWPVGNFKAADEEEGSTVHPLNIYETRYCEKEKFNLDYLLKFLGDQPRYFSSWGYKLTPYRPFGTQSVSTFKSDWSNRLSVLQEVASMSYYEFYVDGAGNVQYHPMRLANDFLLHDMYYASSQPAPGEWSSVDRGSVKIHEHTFPYCQIVGSEELTAINKTFNVEEMVTFLRLSGQFVVYGNFEPEVTGLVGSYLDTKNLAKFGFRRKEHNCPLFNVATKFTDKDGSTKRLVDGLAQVFLEYYNGMLYTMAATMIFRPELELALPILLADDNEDFYIQSINHSIIIGETAQTVVQCSFGRKFTDPAVDLLSYMLLTEQLHEDPNASLSLQSVQNVDDIHRVRNLPVGAHEAQLRKVSTATSELEAAKSTAYVDQRK